MIMLHSCGRLSYLVSSGNGREKKEKFCGLNFLVSLVVDHQSWRRLFAVSRNSRENLRQSRTAFESADSSEKAFQISLKLSACSAWRPRSCLLGIKFLCGIERDCCAFGIRYFLRVNAERLNRGTGFDILWAHHTIGAFKLGKLFSINNSIPFSWFYGAPTAWRVFGISTHVGGT